MDDVKAANNGSVLLGAYGTVAYLEWRTWLIATIQASDLPTQSDALTKETLTVMNEKPSHCGFVPQKLRYRVVLSYSHCFLGGSYSFHRDSRGRSNCTEAPMITKVMYILDSIPIASLNSAGTPTAQPLNKLELVRRSSHHCISSVRTNS